jgi:flagellar operon protein
MEMGMRIDNLASKVNLLEIVNRGKTATVGTADKSAKTVKENFSTVLAETQKVNFSKHARERLYSRGIELSDNKLGEISQAIDKAALKGSRETLILDDNAAYLVSVPNRTIVTAFGKENLREGVVTSIDSAIIL